MFQEGFPFRPVMGPLSDLLGLRLPLPLQSRPAQISEGTHDGTDERRPAPGNMTTVSV